MTSDVGAVSFFSAPEVRPRLSVYDDEVSDVAACVSFWVVEVVVLVLLLLGVQWMVGCGV